MSLSVSKEEKCDAVRFLYKIEMLSYEYLDKYILELGTLT